MSETNKPSPEMRGRASSGANYLGKRIRVAEIIDEAVPDTGENIDIPKPKLVSKAGMEAIQAAVHEYAAVRFLPENSGDTAVEADDLDKVA